MRRLPMIKVKNRAGVKQETIIYNIVNKYSYLILSCGRGLSDRVRQLPDEDAALPRRGYK
jgi:hypothetical protein